MDLMKLAMERKEETVAHRRFFHANAEVGLEMPKACAYLEEQLRSIGLEPRRCGKGVTATIGSGRPVILLRADMDALPMKEESGLPFACPDGAAHTCGHDFHAAMLLTASKLLTEQTFRGTVKLMFQPAEEPLTGCRNMLEAGILADPVPEAALACHVSTGHAEPGLCLCNSSSTMMFSVDNFEIRIFGKGAHGAYPQHSVDPINIGVHLHLALQSLIARESAPTDACALTIGQFEAGTALNIIPDRAVLRGSLRTNNRDAQEKLSRRLREVAEGTAAVFGGRAEVEILSSIPPLCCDGELTKELSGYVQELGITVRDGIEASASEDFALIAEKIPSVYFYLMAGFADERGSFPAHNPKVLFHEDVLPLGAAAYAHCALRWLENRNRGSCRARDDIGTGFSLSF